MVQTNLDAVTGAFSYTGKYIARRLLADGKQVLNLTRDPGREHEFGSLLRSVPFSFEDPQVLSASLAGAGTLYNTYWIRFNYSSWTFDQAVKNTRLLVEAARNAGVQRIVHVSVTNARADSPLAYFRGKSAVEELVRNCGLSYAIIRPTLIFGLEDLLLNNIVYLLRHFPLFVIPGDGNYRLQPISAEETADLCVRAAQQNQNLELDAAGPDILTFRELVRMLKIHTGSTARMVYLPAALALGFSRLVGWITHDITLSSEELRGLMEELLVSEQPPAGQTRLEDWLKEHGKELGNSYVSELRRNYLPYNTHK
ncbi:MAG: epimerase [Chloroflexi bacterium RBG_16_54_18]|nr:MAG: epimerase [Chloroflexi bacterium RBG_16_54_18]